MKNNRKSIVIYLAVVFVLSYAAEIFFVAPRLKAVSSGEVTDAMAIGLTQAMVAMCMFFPALSVLITRAVTNDWDGCYLRPNLKGNVVPYLIGWFGPLVLVCVGGGVWFLLHPESLTPFCNPYAAVAPGAGGVVLFVLLLILFRQSVYSLLQQGELFLHRVKDNLGNLNLAHAAHRLSCLYNST